MMRAVYTKAIVREPAQEQLHAMADKDLSRGRTPQHVRVKDLWAHTGAVTAEDAGAT